MRYWITNVIEYLEDHQIEFDSVGDDYIDIANDFESDEIDSLFDLNRWFRGVYSFRIELVDSSGQNSFRITLLKSENNA